MNCRCRGTFRSLPHYRDNELLDGHGCLQQCKTLAPALRHNAQRPTGIQKRQLTPNSKNREMSPALLSSDLFKGLSRSSIAKIVLQSSWSEHPTGAMLFLQGSPAKEFFLLESGLVRLHELTKEGDDVLIHLITPGQVFGCFALTSRPNPASAEVVFPASVLKWSSRTIIDLLGEIPQVAVNLIDIALHHVVHFHERVRRFERDSVSDRVRWALANLTSVAGKKTQQGMVIEYAGSHRILAQLAGTNIYSVSRELCKLEREGMLSKQRGRILVPNLDNLDCF